MIATVKERSVKRIQYEKMHFEKRLKRRQFNIENIQHEKVKYEKNAHEQCAQMYKW